MSETTFSSLKLNPWLVRQCATIGLKHPTPIQVHCIPAILSGRDCIGAAKTGSGKTLAFALPILQRLCEDPYGIYTLVLTPTRELAYQIADQFALMGKPMNLRHTVIVGGMDMITQGKELARKPHIVVATPGRLADHLGSCDTFTLSRIQFLVLDEADRLLGGMFDEQIRTIFKALPKKRQNLFFSATITDTLEKLKSITQQEMFLYEAPAEVATVDQLDQFYVLCPKDVKDAYLVQTVRTFRETNGSGNIMIFTESCRKCQILSMTFIDIGFDNVALHSMIAQKNRLSALAKFKSNTVKILLATDVAARGLDIPSVQLVINHCMPREAKEYVHRVGRTARAGRKGKAITMITPYDIEKLHAIEEFIGTKLSDYKIDDSEVGRIFTQISVTKSEAQITLEEKDFYEKRMINKKKKWILQGLDPDEEEAKLMKKRKKGGKKEKVRMPKKDDSSAKEEDNSVNKEVIADDDKTRKEAGIRIGKREKITSQNGNKTLMREGNIKNKTKMKAKSKEIILKSDVK